MSYPSLLPPGSTALQKALEQTAAGLLDIPVPLRETWSPVDCPIEDLPWLAWGLSIDVWDSNWTESQKREAVADAIQFQRTKGTRASLRTVLDRFDTLIEIVEWSQDRDTLDPYSFRLELPLLAQSDVFYNEALVGQIMRDIAQAKPVRAHMLAVYRVRAEARAWLVSAAQAGGLTRLDSLADQSSALDPVWDSFLQTRDGEPILAKGGDYLVVNPGPFDFSAPVMPVGAAIERPGPANRFNIAGGLVSEVSNVPRFAYDRLTHLYLGLMVEASATNHIANNTMQGAAIGPVGAGGAIPTNWNWGSAAGLTRDVVSAPVIDGINYLGLRFHGVASSTAALVLRPEPAIALGLGTQWTNSVYLAIIAGSLANVASLQLRAGGEAGQTNWSTVSAIPRRYSNTRLLSSSANGELTLRWNYAAVGVAVDFTLLIGLPQRETGDRATSPIKTAGAPVTRPADALHLDWAARAVPDGPVIMRVFFDDGSTQDVPGTVAAGIATITGPLNRTAIQRVERVA